MPTASPLEALPWPGPPLSPPERALAAWVLRGRAAHADRPLVRWQQAMYGDAGVACYAAALLWQLTAGALGLVGAALLVASRAAGWAYLPLVGCGICLLVGVVRAAQMARAGRRHRAGAPFVKQAAWSAAEDGTDQDSRSS